MDKNNLLEKFGQNLRRIRKERGFSSGHQLARKLYIDSNTIYNYENGRRFPTFEILVDLMEVLNCSFEDLIGRSVD